MQIWWALAGSTAGSNEYVLAELSLAPSILCVVEMQVHKSRVERLAGTLGYDNVFVVSSTCHSGGLGIFSNNEIKLDLLCYS
jgi:hypothetical protein